MVALGTVDMLMIDHGEDKGKMLGQFLSKNQGMLFHLIITITMMTNTGVATQLQRALKGDQLDNDEDDDDDDDDIIVESKSIRTAQSSHSKMKEKADMKRIKSFGGKWSVH
jgi:hypothetical protein